MVLKMFSVVVLGPPPHPHEQLKFLTVLLAAIRFKTSFGCELYGLPSKTMILERPGAIAMAISISSETSSLPEFGTPL